MTTNRPYNDIKWNQHIQELKKYKEKHGNCDVPIANFGLGRWVSNQRRQYKKLKKEGKKSSTLTDKRIKELEAIGFAWSVRFDGLTFDELWNRKFEELKEYRKKHGNCNVPSRYPGNKPLGTWVSWQRQQYKFKKEGKKSTLTDKRIKELEAIGFVWTFDELWNRKFEELKEYRNKHGNCNVPSRYSSNKPLGTWVHNQRMQYKFKKEGKKAKITDKRIKELEAIGFVWKIKGPGSRSTVDPVAPTNIESKKKRKGDLTNKARKRKSQEVVEEGEQEPCPKEPTELERIKRRRIVKEKLKNWRCKPGSSISDLW